MNKLFRICNHDISVEANHFPKGNDDWIAFEADKFESGIKITCHVSDTLPSTTAPFIGENGDAKVYSDGNTVFREISMATLEGAQTVYSNGNVNQSTSYFTAKSFNTMMDSRYMWNSLALPQLFLLRKTIFLHASYLGTGGKALLFSAPCGTGKSTQAALWQKHRNAEIINGDKAGISVCDNKAFAHGVPFCGTSGICKNRSLPLGAIVFLSQSPQNTVTKLRGTDALQKLMENTYLDFLAPDEQRMFVDVAIEILNSVPVYGFACTPTPDAVNTLENTLKAEGVI